MKTKVTEECIACNLCIEACPDIYEMGDDGIAHPKVDEVPEESQDCVRESAEACPVDAIIVEE